MERVLCVLCSTENDEPLLKATNTRNTISKEEFNLVKCPGCGLIYINPRPRGDELARYYRYEYYAYKPTVIEKLYSKILFQRNRASKKVGKYRTGGKILDIGCGVGDLLLEMKEKGWDIYGTETSHDAYVLAKERLKEYIYNCELAECRFESNSFDVITLWHVLEHVANPAELLREINRILKQDGILFIEVPNVANPVFWLIKENYFALDTPRHLYHYSLDTLKALLAQNGFTIKTRAFPMMAFPLSLFTSFSNVLRFRHGLGTPVVLFLVALSSPFLLLLTVLFRIYSRFTPTGEIMQLSCCKS